MKLNERGITVGDLLLVLIFVISTIFVINKVKDSDNKALFQLAPNNILTAKRSLFL